MKYVLCAAPEGSSQRQLEIRWTYICEGSPKVGDTVFAQFGYEDEYLEVVQVATKRSKLDTAYDGALKSARIATGEELFILAKIEAGWMRVANLEQKVCALNDDLSAAQARANG